MNNEPTIEEELEALRETPSRDSVTVASIVGRDTEIELIALRSMCRAAAAEIREYWEAHCDKNGYGPCNLMARLEGRVSPDLYPGFATPEDCARYIELTSNAALTERKPEVNNG